MLKPLTPMTKLGAVLYKVLIVLIAVQAVFRTPGFAWIFYRIRWDVFQVLNQVFAVLVLLVETAAVIVLLVWVHRLSARLRLQADVPPRHSPGWAVGWFFVPVASLFKPYQVMRELAAVASKGRQTRFPLIGWWWGLFLVGTALWTGADTMTRFVVMWLPLRVPYMPTFIGLIPYGTVIAAWVCLIVLTSRITRDYTGNYGDSVIAAPAPVTAAYGASAGTGATAATGTPTDLATPGIGVAGFILSLIGISVVGIALSWVGYAQAKREGRRSGLCLAGIIIGFVWIALVSIGYAVYLVLVLGLL